ncbi:hypothetical protein [Mucilaginibacter sp. L196]|uniref:hypothetical protein n=1 Tax=Mucilaginibacter sp. L196 TaxID=1641870 RepID=UPI00131B3C89|nr:hypothetical protein [Mucilaginibacter sp. L196]
MKKLLLSSVILLTFAVSLLIFNLSCKKEAKAQSSQPLAQQGKIFFIKSVSNENQLWTASYDGSNQQEINLALPTGTSVDGISSISPDKKTVFVAVANGSSDDIYTCNIDGSNLRKIISDTGSNVISY